MLNRFRDLIGLLILVFAAGYAQASTKDPLVLAERMAQAAQNQSFYGTFAYLYEGRIDTLSIHHKYLNGKLCERLVALNGPYRELIKRGEELFGYYDPNNVKAAQMGLANPLPMITQEMVPLIPKNYVLTYEGETRIAGEKAAILFMKPKINDRYGHRFWVHIKTGLLLRHDVIASSSAAVQSVIFTQVDFSGDLPESLFKPRSTRHLYTHALEDKPQTSWSKVFKLKSLPKGFVNTEQLMRFSLVNKNTFEHWVFTDGVAKLSLFFEPHQNIAKEQPATNVMQKGATLAYGKLTNGHLITLVGDVPEATAKKVLDSIEYKQD